MIQIFVTFTSYFFSPLNCNYLYTSNLKSILSVYNIHITTESSIFLLSQNSLFSQLLAWTNLISFFTYNLATSRMSFKWFFAACLHVLSGVLFQQDVFEITLCSWTFHWFIPFNHWVIMGMWGFPVWEHHKQSWCEHLYSWVSGFISLG